MRSRAALAIAVSLCALAAIPAGASAEAPTIPLTTFSATTTTSTTLEADINPQGKATKYHFEYGPSDCSANACTSTPVPDAQVPAGTTAVRVSAPIEGLSPGTTYHFRVVARHTNEENGETASPDRTFTAFQPPQKFDPCPNDSFRAGPGARLPDCRAYEQASPIDKNGSDLWSLGEWLAVSRNGDAVTFLNDIGIPGGEGAQLYPLYLASRGEDGWSTQGVLPSPSLGQAAHVLGWSPDLSQFYEFAKRDGEPILSTFLSRSSEAGALTTISPYVSDASEHPFGFAGASTGGSVVLFESTAKLPGTAAVQGKPNVYAWTRATGAIRLVGLMNDGSAPPAGSIAGPYDWYHGTTPATLQEGGVDGEYYVQDERALAADGTAAFFTATATATASGRLYERLNPTAEQSAMFLSGSGDEECAEIDKGCTVQLNASEKTNGSGPSNHDAAGSAPAAFQAASNDGRIAFFTSSEKLTDNANTGIEPAPPAIARSTLEGQGADFSFLSTSALNLAIEADYLYWTDPKTNAIGRAKLNGSGSVTEVEPEFVSIPDLEVQPGVLVPANPRGIAVNSEHLFWTSAGAEEGEGTIGRAKLNGAASATQIEPELVDGVGNPQGLALDSEHLYWTNSILKKYQSSSGEGESSIGKAKLDGTEVETKLVEEPNRGQELSGIAVDAEHIYWMSTLDSGGRLFVSGILRTNLDGGSYDPAFTGTAGFHRDRAGIAVQAGHIYWSAQELGDVGRAKLNGAEEASEVDSGFIEDAGHPLGIALDGENIFWAANQGVEPNPGNDLYRYSTQPDSEGHHLTDLTPDPVDAIGADVRGIIGTSEDGSYVYFVANAVLAPDAAPGNCTGPDPDNETGSCNLYLAHDGETRFVARLGALERNWRATPQSNSDRPRASRLTPDGRTLLYSSQGNFYRYRAPDQSTVCISCNPSGEPGGARDPSIEQPSQLYPKLESPVLDQGSLSHNGNLVFFESAAGLVGADIDGRGACPKVGETFIGVPSCLDVYEWEAPGTPGGSCSEASRAFSASNGGCLYLLSTGTEATPSFFAGASVSGDDVFIFTRAPLVGQDTDELRDVYDLRVDGGLASQYPVRPSQCEAEACKGPLTPAPSLPAPTTPAFRGGANLAERKGCPKGKRRERRHGKVRCLNTSHHHRLGKPSKAAGGRGL